MLKKKRMDCQLSTVSTQLRVRTETYVFSSTLITVLIGISSSVFLKICRTSDCANYLLPNKRPVELLDRLRYPGSLPGILCWTNRFYKSFIPYALNHYQ
jgi:hypothetical protein